MIATATMVSHGHGENSSANGATISTTVPGPCAMKRRQVRRPQVVGEVAVVRPLEPLERHGRAVAHHRRDDVGEVQAELRDTGPEPHRDDQQLAAR